MFWFHINFFLPDRKALSTQISSFLSPSPNQHAVLTFKPFSFVENGLATNETTNKHPSTFGRQQIYSGTFRHVTSICIHQFKFLFKNTKICQFWMKERCIFHFDMQKNGKKRNTEYINPSNKNKKRRLDEDRGATRSRNQREIKCLGARTSRHPIGLCTASFDGLR